MLFSLLEFRVFGVVMGNNNNTSDMNDSSKNKKSMKRKHLSLPLKNIWYRKMNNLNTCI